MLYSSVLASFADAKLLDFFPKQQQQDFTYKGTLCVHMVYTVLPSLGPAADTRRERYGSNDSLCVLAWLANWNM